MIYNVGLEAGIEDAFEDILIKEAAIMDKVKKFGRKAVLAGGLAAAGTGAAGGGAIAGKHLAPHVVNAEQTLKHARQPLEYKVPGGKILSGKSVARRNKIIMRDPVLRNTGLEDDIALKKQYGIKFKEMDRMRLEKAKALGRTQRQAEKVYNAKSGNR